MQLTGKIRVEAIHELRRQTGLGLRAAVDALEKHGTLEAALAALADPRARDEHENVIHRDKRHAELYRALRDSGRYVPAFDGRGWSIRIGDDKLSTAEALDAAALALFNNPPTRRT